MPRRPHAPRPIALLAVVAGAAAFFSAAPAARAGSSASLMDVSADGALLACANRDGGTVTVVDLKTHKKLREVAVGRKPEGVTFLGRSHKLAVAVYHDDKVVFLDGDSGAAVGHADVFDEPYGVVSNAAGDRVYATLSYPGQVVEIDAASFEVTRTIEAGPFARGLAITPDDRRLYVTEYHTGNVVAVDLAAGAVADRWTGVASDNLARHVVLHPTRAKAYLPHIRSATAHAHGEGSIFPYVSVLDTGPAGSPGERRRKRIPMDSFVGVHVTANPWEVAVAPDGRKLLAVFSGTNDLYACEVVDDDYRELRWRATVRLGNNPRAVRVSPDGKRFYVYNALDFNVVAYDADTLRPAAEVAVSDARLPAELLAGKRLFYTALQPMVGRRWIACSSCHVDGESDARTWQNPEGLRDTPGLGGMAWTHPLHWSADRDEAQDFEHTIRGQLMQGRGLIHGKAQPDLGEPNKGRSADLDALAAYCNSHAVPLSPHAKRGLNESAARGRDVFRSEQAACTTCHAGPFYTDSRPAGADAADAVGRIVRHDVGTGGDDPSEKMGPRYDTPTLLGLYKTAPYLHHGKAATLRDVLTTQNRTDRHGRTSHLTPREVDDLVEFLKGLPYLDPEPEARAMGMKKVER